MTRKMLLDSNRRLLWEHGEIPHAPFSLHIQHKVPFNCLFDFLRLNTDVSLGNGCAAVLKELLYKDDVIVAVLVVSRVMRKFALVSGRNLLQGGGLTAPGLLFSGQGAKGQGRRYAARLALDALRPGCYHPA